jgi:hypothetical protein
MAKDAESGERSAIKIPERHIVAHVTFTQEEIALAQSNPEQWIDECWERDIKRSEDAMKEFFGHV